MKLMLFFLVKCATKGESKLTSVTLIPSLQIMSGAFLLVPNSFFVGHSETQTYSQEMEENF